MEALRRHWTHRLGAPQAGLYLWDTKPLSVLGYKRRKDQIDFVAMAYYGVCVSWHMKYSGYKRVLLRTRAGTPVIYVW